MAIITGLVTGAAAANRTGILDPLKDSFFGSSEKGSGLTKAGTLAHAIDKLDKADDFEATKIANDIKSLIAAGQRSVTQFISKIERDLGYRAGQVETSDKASYIKQMIQEEIKKAESGNAASLMSTAQTAGFNAPGFSAVNNFNKYIIPAAAIGAGLWYFIFRNK